LFPYLTLLWSPHATWALCAAFLLFPQAGTLSTPSTRTLALILALSSAAVLSLWALYCCQMTMLHGDEAHYLRVTQSLLYDGDMDLANNLGPGQVKEYHVIDFPPHTAPGSPPGKIHSVHPIGLSALLLPAYWTGLQLWDNPRLACSLSMAWGSAGVITLIFLWLMRLGFRTWHALACTLVGATTTPLLLYTTQLYPEIPALLITLLALLLLAHWQQPGPQYRSLGTREPLLLAGLGLLLFCLLFLHPRYLPLALYLGAGIGLQVRHSPQRRQLMRWCIPLGAVGFLSLLAYNYAYSGDLFGPFLPGNAWEGGALKGSTWLISLPGQWLHSTTGLLNSSPIFLASALGLVLMVLKRDPRGGGALTFYLCTAGVNGLHPDWTFGFCPPARFLITALPLLLWGLALFLEQFSSRVMVLFALLFALALSYDGVIRVVAMPEQGFGGNHLSVRSLDEFYSWDIHFFTQTTDPLPWADLCFWALIAAALAAALFPSLERRWRWACLLAAGLLPSIWGQTGALAGRLSTTSSPYLLQLNSSGDIPSVVQFFNRPIQSEYQMTTGHAIKAGGFGAQAPGPAGVLKAYYAPLIQPGINSYSLSEVYAENAPGQVAGHLIIAQRRTLPAISDWGIFHSCPIASTGDTLRTANLSFLTDFTGLSYAYVEFAGAGALAFKEARTRFLPIHFGARYEEVRHFPSTGAPATRAHMGVHCENLEKGFYLVRFELKGTAFGTFFERRPVPVSMAVYAAQNTPKGFSVSLADQASNWFSVNLALQDPHPRPDVLRPLVESLQAPWWTAVPVAGSGAFEMEFGLHTPQDVWLLIDYPGPAALQLEGITLYRKILSTPLSD
ncbi:MAG: hypothetical protein HYW07_19895, partial [Candidatus Latescibacteria bacterium]|nr:hypothetical protein [Candidatus Latescibacterota bacterium]